MPKPFVYRTGDMFTARLRVEDGADQGNVVVDIGGQKVAVNAVNLDAADTRPAKDRPLTDEEADRKRLADEQRQAARASRR